jgi:arginase
VHEAVHAELGGGRLPTLLGGDHCLAIGSISAAARHCRDTGLTLRVLWIDSHADFNTNTLTPTGNIHGMSVACLCGRGPEALIDIGGTVRRMGEGKFAGPNVVMFMTLVQGFGWL